MGRYPTSEDHSDRRTALRNVGIRALNVQKLARSSSLCGLLLMDGPDTSLERHMVAPDLFARRHENFCLWRPAVTDPVPQLVVGQRAEDHGHRFLQKIRQYQLAKDPDLDGLWIRAWTDCDLTEGEIYHYWFAVTDSRPELAGFGPIWVTDPFAQVADWQILAPALPAPYGALDRSPAAVVKVEDRRLVECDPDGAVCNWQDDPGPTGLPSNERSIYYKLPTRWSRRTASGGSEVGIGTLRDVQSLVDPAAASPTFPSVAALGAGSAYLQDLGVNVLELSPIADSPDDLEWGYGTEHYFAPDFGLTFAPGAADAQPLADVSALVSACHAQGMKFGYDAVMAFARRDPYVYANYLDFHVQHSSGDPEEAGRDAFGGQLWKYNYWPPGYDPVDGENGNREPARQFMKAHIARWIADRRIDSIRVDSVANIRNWDFVGEFTGYARDQYREHWEAATGCRDDPAADQRFLVVGEELSMPQDLVLRGYVDALWNEWFKRAVRQAILGHNADDEPSFEWTIRKLIDPRNLNYSSLTQLVNYVTSHDVAGLGNERLYNFLQNNRVYFTAERIKLAFACLLTAAGIPMILAGEEFADQHDLPITDEDKQIDPVDYSRLDDPWRKDVHDYVQRLIALRTHSNALAVIETTFLHTDFDDGKRILVWKRGASAEPDPVIVLANFSDWGSVPGTGYVVPDWPQLPRGRQWLDVTADKMAPTAGNDPIAPWSARVYRPQ